MNKNITESYALIEDMAQNHYQWTSEHVTIATTPLPNKKEAGMYEVSALDLLSAKLDSLTQKVECQLGTSAGGVEQLNYAKKKGPIFKHF